MPQDVGFSLSLDMMMTCTSGELIASLFQVMVMGVEVAVGGGTGVTSTPKIRARIVGISTITTTIQPKIIAKDFFI
jgi:hypothetical protein